MKSMMEQLLKQALQRLQQSKMIPPNVVVDIKVDRTKEASHGAYATNLALILAKSCGYPQRKVAELLVQAFPAHPLIERIEVAGPGFINFFMDNTECVQVIGKVLNEDKRFGQNCIGAARFPSLMRKSQQSNPMDLAIAKSSDDSVYYIQYAHARISSLLRQLQERQLSWDEQLGLNHLDLLMEPQESLLISLINRYPEVIESAVRACEPHQMAYYLRELANGVHSYYNAMQLLCEQEELRCARLCLLKAVRQVLHNGIQLLGISAPESI